jgi:hypothetical protein
MQSYRFDEVIKRSCKKNDLNYELMRSFSDHIFLTTKKEMGKFDKLRIYLKGMFSWFYGYKKLQTFDTKVVKRVEEGRSNIYYLNDLTDEQAQNLKEKIDAMKDTYVEFIANKKETKTKYRQEKNESNREIPSVEGE